ncbi:MAG: hypothetical protein RIM72_00620 [Alphaproteobacteria bacterium]
MIFHWPVLTPEPQGRSRRARRRRSAEVKAIGGYLNMDGSYNESYQKAIANDPLPQPKNPLGRPVLPKREANAPRYETLGNQLRDHRTEYRRIPKGEDDSLANVIGKDSDGNDIFTPPGFVPVWDDDMETVLGHMDWQKGIAVPLGNQFPSPEVMVREFGVAVKPEPISISQEGETSAAQTVPSVGEAKQDTAEETQQSAISDPDPQKTQNRRTIPDRPDLRAGEDIAMWEARKNREDRIIQSNAQDTVFERGKSDFDALADTGEATVRQGSEYTAKMVFGENAILSDLDSTGAARLAGEAAEDPALLEALRQTAEGSLDLDEIDARLNDLQQLSQSSFARAARRRGKDYLGPERRGELERLTILKGVAEAQADGATSEEVGQLLINGFAPDRSEDMAVARELFLDMLPIIGEIRSARDAVENFDAMVKAIEAGDWDAAAEAGLFTALGAAGAVPLVGRMTKLALPLLKRGLVGKLIAQNRLARFEKEFNNPKVNPALKQDTLFDGVKINVEPKVLGLKINGGVGEAAENEVIQDFDRAGFGPQTSFDSRAARTKKNSRRPSRIYDGATRYGAENYKGWLLRPVDDSSGTAIEVKSGGGTLSLAQAEFDSIVNETGLMADEYRDFAIGKVRNLRVRLDQISYDNLKTSMTKVLDDAVERGYLDRQSADVVFNRIMAAQKASSADNPITLQAVLTGLRPVDEE